MAQKLVCDRCEVVYDDEGSVTSAKKMANQWKDMCIADGVEPRGISPCPNLQCDGELILKDE